MAALKNLEIHKVFPLFFALPSAIGARESEYFGYWYSFLQFSVIVQNRNVGTALLSNELWKLLGANSNPLAADYTMQMVKPIRSQGGIAGVVSQGRRT